LKGKIVLATIFGVILWKIKVLLLIETFMSEDFVVKFLANAEPIVAKNFLKTFAMSFLSLTSFPSFMIKDAVLFLL